LFGRQDTLAPRSGGAEDVGDGPVMHRRLFGRRDTLAPRAGSAKDVEIKALWAVICRPRATPALW
jgi:hypothetical protein